MTEDRVSFVVHLPSRAEKREEMRRMLFEVLDAMAEEPDFVCAWLHEQLDHPDTLVVYETWACTREQFIAHHLSKPYRQAYEAALPTLLSADRRIDFLKPIRDYPHRATPAISN